MRTIAETKRLLDCCAAQRLNFTVQLVNTFLLVFANHAQLSNDVSELFDVLIFDHQVHSVLSQALNDG